MDLGLKGKPALITGSSRGLGRAIAQALAAEGADIAICARGEADLERARAELADEHDVRVVAVPVDLSKVEDIGRLIEKVERELGSIRVLVTNTGGPPAGPFEAHPPEVWREAVVQNLESVVNLTRAVLPGMKEGGWGRIVNITSIAVKQPVENLILSNSVRAAVTGFARTLANEVARDGITVNNVLPGYTRTERLGELARKLGEARGEDPQEAYARWEREIPMGRLGEPAELASLVAFLVSERASFITGTSIPVDGGWTRSLF